LSYGDWIFDRHGWAAVWASCAAAGAEGAIALMFFLPVFPDLESNSKDHFLTTRRIMMRLTKIGLSIAAVAAVVIPILAQIPTGQKNSFEVASIKVNNSGNSDSRTSCCAGGYFKAVNDTLKSLILTHYRLRDFQLVGGPDWISTARPRDVR
jgi:hypothetical protein